MLHKVFKCRGYSLDLSKKTLIMGILNVTPDSFSDAGSYMKPQAAYRRALQMEQEGADIIDIGGESTRPGSSPVSEKEEIRRVIPVLERLEGRIRIPISVDTNKPEVARQALEHGASIINDITGLHKANSLAGICSRYNAGLIIMHMKGTPRNMQKRPVYNDILKEIHSYLKQGISVALKNGVSRESIIIDPGIGFGKTVSHNLKIIKGLSYFKRMGFPVMVGISRKSFIGRLLDLEQGQRLLPTIAADVVAICNGADMIRVHDVRQAYISARMADAVISVK